VRSPVTANDMTMRWSPWERIPAPDGRPGRISIQSGPVATSVPRRRRFSAQASSRSHSFTRVLATSSMRTGPSAKGATAARVGMVSETSRMATVSPRRVPVPRTVVRSAATVTSAPIRRSTSTKPRSPWRAPSPRPGTVTSAPGVTAAAAKK
jgi:hypothetical protein